MRRLLPGPPADLDEAALTALYAPPPGRHLRANMVVSADGAATVDGSSTGLSSPADGALLGLLRALADAVLVGAGTARAEAYRPLRVRPHRAEARRDRGQAEVPTLALVTASGDVRDVPAVREGPGPVLVLTTGDGARRAAGLPGHVELAVLDEPTPAAALQALHDRGLAAVLTEGGPRWLGQVAAADVLDELCLTVAPLLAGPGAERVVAGDAPVPVPRGLTLSSVAEDGGALFLRYARAR